MRSTVLMSLLLAPDGGVGDAEQVEVGLGRLPDGEEVADPDQLAVAARRRGGPR